MTVAGLNERAGRAWRIWTVVSRWLAIGTVPLSIVTAGATVSMAFAALYGLVVHFRGVRMSAELMRVHRFMCFCYGALVVIDLLNGGGLINLGTTGVNYLHLVALAPLAHAFVVLDIDDVLIERMLAAAVWLALAHSAYRFFVIGEIRPGGPGLNPIPYGFVVALWGAFLLARGLERQGQWRFALITACAALVPVLLTESRIVWVAMIAGYLVVLATRIRRSGSLTEAWWVLGLGLPLLAVAYVTLAHRRLAEFAGELDAYIEHGTIAPDSFGYRFELLRSALRAIADKPVLGHGIADRLTVPQTYADPSGPSIEHLGHLHNDYVTHLVAFGAPGLVFVLAFLGMIVVIGRRSGTVWREASAYALAVMLGIYMFSDVVFNMDPMSGGATVALAILLARSYLPGRAAGPAADGTA